MPLFEVLQGDLVPFRRLRGGAELFEKEIEDLLWANLEEFTGDAFLALARQPKLGSGGFPDVVALDKSGRVVVFEVKRDVDRRQLAQCLEYAGWARKASLDELASLYHRGESAFWADWQEFTESATPVLVNPKPRLVLVARDFEGRTESAFEFLLENGLPVTVIRVAVYEDTNGRRFVDVEGEHEPGLPAPVSEREVVDHTKIRGRRMRLDDLIEHGLLKAGDLLVFDRPKLGQKFEAKIAENGAIELADGRAFASPSRAAMEVAGIAAYDGWYAWRLATSRVLLNDLRKELVDRLGRAGEA